MQRLDTLRRGARLTTMAALAMLAACQASPEAADPGFGTLSGALTAAVTVAPMPCTLGGPANGSPLRATWASGSAATSSSATSAFVNFARNHGIREVYLDATSLTGAQVAAFASAAAASCTQVDLQIGNATWALAANQAAALATLQAKIGDIQAIASGPRPVGIHFSVPAYLASTWSTAQNSTANAYLDLLDKALPLVHGAGLRLTADIPFWYDTVSVTRGGIARPMHQWLIDRSDRVSMTDFRDTAAAITSLGQTEVNYAGTVGRKVVLGVETACGLSPTSLSFCEEGAVKMDTVLTSVAKTGLAYSGFGGIAVNSYATYTTLSGAAAQTASSGTVTPTPEPTPTPTPTPTPEPTPTPTPEPTPTPTVSGCTAVGPGGSPARALWVWTSAPATNSTERQKLMDFARSKGVNAFFISGPSIGGNASTLTSFSQAAKDACATVELLYGSSSWALTANHGTALNYATTAANAIKTMTGVRPTALHYDVEPYTLSQWSSDMNGTANQYLDLLEKLVPIAHGAGLKLNVDIPFWYDSKLVTRGGVTRPMNEWVQDRADTVVLMDYRETAAEIIALGATEIAYAAKIGKKTVLGVETICGLSPETVTFCEEGQTAMDSALTTTQTKFAGNAGYGGLAVHHYGSYLTTKN